MDLDAFRRRLRIAQVKRRDVRVLRHKLLEKGLVRRQLALELGAALRRGSRMPTHPDRPRRPRACRRPEPQAQRRRSPAQTLLDIPLRPRTRRLLGIPGDSGFHRNALNWVTRKRGEFCFIFGRPFGKDLIRCCQTALNSSQQGQDSASEKLEIIRTVEASYLPTPQALAVLGIPRMTKYRWYDRWSEGGLDALEDPALHPVLTTGQLVATRVALRLRCKAPVSRLSRTISLANLIETQRSRPISVCVLPC